MSDPEAAATAILAEARMATDQLLEARAVALEADHPAPLGQALAYALRSSGKRVRPALVLASYRAAGGASPGIAGVAAAVEIVHTYSLVHDDLPCMDDDSQRRGRPTTHIMFDVDTATRVGWLLVPVAVEMLAESAGRLGLEPERLGLMAGTLLEAGGIRGMIGGQWLDLEAEGRTLPVEGLRQLHRLKTGALIEASCVLGGLAAGAPDERLAGLRGYGREIGLAFQIADDVLDATASSGQLGKTAGRDAALAKSTYVSVMGVDAARDEARERGRQAVQALAAAGVATETLAGLAGYIVERSS